MDLQLASKLVSELSLLFKHADFLIDSPFLAEPNTDETWLICSSF